MTGVKNPAVLLLHGFLGSPQNWRACAETLSARYRVLVPELPIFSGRQPAECQEHVLRFLVEQIAAAKARQWVVIGNSLGGTLAVHLAQREPERVIGLVLTGSGGLFQPKPSRIFYRRPGREWLRGCVREIFFDEAMVTEAMVDELQAIFRDRKKFIEVVRLAKNIRRMSVQETLPRVHCPVLLVWGAEDKVTPPDTANDFKQLLPDAEVHFLSRCGHAPMMERPAEFNRLVTDFLQRIAARSGAIYASRQAGHDLMSRT